MSSIVARIVVSSPGVSSENSAYFGEVLVPRRKMPEKFADGFYADLLESLQERSASAQDVIERCFERNLPHAR
jgi:hypothetical protein